MPHSESSEKDRRLAFVLTEQEKGKQCVHQIFSVKI